MDPAFSDTIIVSNSNYETCWNAEARNSKIQITSHDQFPDYCHEIWQIVLTEFILRICLEVTCILVCCIALRHFTGLNNY
jgi:hypothetical protein